jgi:crotonobetainyl-CoA:carnitine CoA-transferase CaiB-like acyl-CoA transferase
MHDEKIFEGVKVLDLTTFVTGGFCSLMLANQGADVVKIERPGVGDDNRHSGPPFIDGESPYFWTVNYGKKSVELDLKTEAGLEALYDLVEKADVFLQNFRPGTAERIGVDDETIRSHNDEIVYCAISAFGQTGPWSQRPGYDLIIQGMSGIMSVTGEADGQPMKVGLPMTDLITAMWAAFGISGALYRRKETGEGEYIDLGMLDSALPWLTKQAGKAFAGDSPTRMGTKDPVLAPYQTFPTADGYINVAALNEKLWGAFCEAIEHPELEDDDRFGTNSDRVDNMEELEAIITEILEERTTDEWMTRIVEEAGVPAGPVLDVENALYNEQTEARDVMTTLEHPEHGEVPAIEHPLNYENADSGFEAPAPRLGEHNRSVFEEIGYTEREIEALEEAGVFGDE